MRTSSTIFFEVKVPPAPKGRPRTVVRSGVPIVYTPRATRRAEDAIKGSLRAAGAQLFPRGIPLALRVWFCIPKPRKAPKYLTYSPRRPDLANYLMLLADAGTGVLWADDSQLALIECEKSYALNPAEVGIYVWVKPIRMAGAPDKLGTSW